MRFRPWPWAKRFEIFVHAGDQDWRVLCDGKRDALGHGGVTVLSVSLDDGEPPHWIPYTLWTLLETASDDVEEQSNDKFDQLCREHYQAAYEDQEAEAS